jgi:hypothetical protein
MEGATEMNRDDAIHALAAAAQTSYEEAAFNIDRFLAVTLQATKSALAAINILITPTNRKARRRRHIVNALNRTRR